jgi:Mn-dependent DtxR family transcriptional regulator
MNTLQKILWTTTAKPREQVLMLRLMDIYGTEGFEATLEDIAKLMYMKRSLVIRMLKGLKELGWVESERQYEYTEQKLPHVKGCKYRFTI